MDVKKVLDDHEDFIKKMVKEKGEVTPMLIWFVNKRVYAAAIVGGRDLIKMAIRKAKLEQPEWMCLMITGYMREFQKSDGPAPDFKHGNLEKGYEWGDPTVKKVVTLQASCGGKTCTRIFEIDKNKVVKKLKEVDLHDSGGYLDIGS